jgi:hypothetical protein
MNIGDLLGAAAKFKNFHELFRAVKLLENF